MTRVFDAYAHYYDLLYRDKDYEEEANYVASFIRAHNPTATRILELGCGTGGHAVHLAALGYTVHGIDLSDSMLARANARKAAQPPEVATRLTFGRGDVRTLRTGKSYDAVVSLFHVMSYQTSNSDLLATFETAYSHLLPGGLFLFDFWYGPAVLTEQPELRVKRLEDEHVEITRIAEPELKVNGSTVDVKYTLFIKDKASQQIQQITESHKLRYLFLGELPHYQCGRFADPSYVRWMTDQPLDKCAWYAFHCAIRT